MKDIGNGPENRDKTGKFKPGQSGNPGGRPTNPFGELIRKKTKDGEEIVDKVLEVLRKSKKNSEILWAAEWLRDTGWHKPIQGLRQVDGEGNDVLHPIQFVPFASNPKTNSGHKGL